ncbi:pyruvate dehydrogenase (acetyl-transferring) E1 component subunit alpha [Aliiroseovarius sp. S1123]|uniref:pyruvate dehydrogenase (acetyl-transferring) E1 component subunit alpha n=1 Tax=unclassified Aliiroseovarius TaxID=2623558 RepID=UPI001FF53FEB|nr:pyruvate dehydrogenase (acetyl-transferring) E1 component subunit alpha [Aliiroseovarius sp. S1123]MCK0171726.1 pyruvate dehydrogenase (acetyl-transferring) E1 component subunit alpha [Aliiroseovarius sp. S1123]
MTAKKPKLDHTHVRRLLQDMIRIRRFEDKCAELYTQEKIRGFLHLYDGEEAIAAGIIPCLTAEDRVVATYREHGHALMRGVSMSSVMTEMYGKAEGCSGGRGGSMHLFDAATNFYGGNAIVGGGLPLAAGLALADHMRSDRAVTACFFGEGAVAEGEFHESMNLAALWQLPVLFVCENNGYAMGTALERSESETDISAKAAAYGVEARVVDGMDVVAVEAAAMQALDHIRSTGQPVFLECRTYRFRPHSMFDAQLYRDKDEVETWRAKGPIVRFQTWLLVNGLIHEDEIAAIEAEVAAEIDEAVAFAEAGTWEPVDTLTKDVMAPSAPPPEVTMPSGALVETTYREAVRTAISDAMARDDRVFLMGEDVGAYGGCYAVSKGLMKVFGPDRIRDTPLSESGFTGAGIGAACAGMRPIVELMTVNFSLLALDQILNTAATLRHMSGGQFDVPVVIRMATGAGKQLAAQHSHSLEGWYAHIPGLKVLAPATLEDARGMLWTALQDPDPVLIFENVMLYNRSGKIDTNAGPVDISRAAIRRPGNDVTLITYGGSLYKTLDAAEALAGEGIDAEVIDLRSLRPLDDETIMASVARTRRAVIVDEGWRSGSLAAEISARITEQVFWTLDAPVGRVCAAEVPIPYPKHLEDASIPQVPVIVAAVKATMGRE